MAVIASETGSCRAPAAAPAGLAAPAELAAAAAAARAAQARKRTGRGRGMAEMLLPFRWFPCRGCARAIPAVRARWRYRGAQDENVFRTSFTGSSGLPGFP